MLNSYKFFKLFSLSQKLGIKPVLFIFCVLFTSIVLKAQQNLVPNGSFEEYYSCPAANDLNDGQFERCKYWWKPTMGTSDYFNRCNNGIVGVPNNLYGHQEPYHGDGYVGIGAVTWNILGQYEDFEYIQSKLMKPLNPCYEYKFSMYLCMSEYSSYAIKRIGALFTKDGISTNNVEVINYSIQYHNDSYFLSDSINWMKIEGSFIAKGGEQYLTIGYFFPNVQNDTMFIQDDFFGSNSVYYFIDSVSLYEIGDVSSKLCDYHINFPNVFTPNNDGVNDIIDLSLYLSFIDKVRIINRWGNTVKVLTKENPIWDGSNCLDGVYYYLVEDEKLKTKQSGFIHLIR